MSALLAFAVALLGDVQDVAQDAAPKKIEQLLVLDLEAIDVPQDKVAFLNGRMASILAERSDIETVTSADIKAMAKLEADKSAAGCDESSCLAEIASALGARYVIYGRVGRLDDLILLQMNLFDASIGKPISRQEAQGAQLKDLAASMPTVISALLRPLGGKTTTAGAVVDAAPPSKPISTLVLVGGGLAAVGVVAGVGLGAWALGLDADLNSPAATLEQKQFAFDNGMWIATGAILGGALAAGGGGLIAVGMME